MLASRWFVLVLLFAVRAGMGLQFQAVGALSPLFMRDFSVGIADIGLLIGLYHAPGIALALPGGAIGQRLGDKSGALIGLALMVAGGVLTALAPGWSLQLAARLLAGTGGILLNVLISKMVADWFVDRELDTAMAIIGNASPVGIALALAALPLIAHASDRTLALWVVVAYLVLSLSALACLYGAPARTQFVAGAGALWPDSRAVWAVLAAGLIYGLYNAGIVAVFTFGPLVLMERGWSIAASGVSTSVFLWVFALSVPIGGYLADRTGHGATILLGGLAGFAGMLALASRVDAVTPAFILLGIVSGLPCGPIMSLPARVLAQQTRSVGMGICFTVYYLVQLLAPWFLGRMAEIGGGARVALDLAAICLCLCGLVWVFFKRVAGGATQAKLPVSAASPRTDADAPQVPPR
jgi:MFS family permease